MTSADEKDKNEEKVYEIWEVPEKLGRYQILQYFYVCIATMFLAMADINFVFVAGDVNYRCRVPECEKTPSLYSAQWWPNSTIDRCSKPVLNETLLNNNCSADSFTGFLEECTEWVYENNDTVVSELNLACEPLKISMIGTIHNAGMLLSTIIAGWMADRFGRKPTLIFFTVATCVGNIKTFATSYYPFVIMEGIEALLSGGNYAATAVLIIEIGGNKQRVLSGVLVAWAIYFTECIFVGIAAIVPYWKTLIKIVYTPSVLCLFLIFVLKESPRWQLVNGQTDKAIESIKYAAKTNNLKVIKRDTADIETKLKEDYGIENGVNRESYRRIFTSKQILIRLLVTMVTRFTNNFVYFGMMINSVFLPGNKYTNFLLSSMMSFPGELLSLYLMNRFGRKLPLMFGFIISAILCAGSGYVPESCIWLKITMFIFGKMLVAACFTGSVVYSMELFPTNARGILLGVCALASEAGSMLAPLTPMLNEISMALPVVIFGGSAALSGILMTLTPETRDLPLMDTVEQVEASMRNLKTKHKDKTENIGISAESVLLINGRPQRQLS